VFRTGLGLSGGVLRQVMRRWGLAAVAAFGLVAAVPVLAPFLAPAQARTSEAPLPIVALADLPEQARATQQLIARGGPFPYAKDASVFGNREHRLPPRARGGYHEYTVPTPGAGDRGARRIICAGPRPEPPQACFYTDDHYATFRRIVP
jgi:ribonuclease T1